MDIIEGSFNTHKRLCTENEVVIHMGDNKTTMSVAGKKFYFVMVMHMNLITWDEGNDTFTEFEGHITDLKHQNILLTLSG